MSEALRLKASTRGRLVRWIFEAIDDAEANREKETRAACILQSVFRMLRDRRHYLDVLRRILTIQAVWRGYLGRVKTYEIRRDAIAEYYKPIFNHAATAIQRTFRGYWSRKWVANYLETRAYLATILQASTETNEKCREEAERQAAEEARLREDTLQLYAVAAANRHHHLVSTASQKGCLVGRGRVPNSAKVLPSGEAMEAIIREKAKLALPARPRPEPSVPHAAPSLPDAPPVPLRGTLNCDDPYDHVDSMKALQSRVESQCKGNPPFCVAVKVPPAAADMYSSSVEFGVQSVTSISKSKAATAAGSPGAALRKPPFIRSVPAGGTIDMRLPPASGAPRVRVK